MTNQNIFRIKIGGQAGQGIKSIGLLLAKIASRSGYNIFTYTEYPSLIRGGHNIIQVNISADEITAPSQKTHLLIALNKQTINLHGSELSSGDGIIYNSEEEIDKSKLNPGIIFYPIPLSNIANTSGGGELIDNTVALGSIIALLNGDLNILNILISEEFKNKSQEIIKSNIIASQGGFDYVKANFSDHVKNILVPTDQPVKKMIVNGNEAVALGAIAGGLQFASIYPMSPISSILEVLAKYQQRYNYIYKQPEDEISAINMAIGASFTGARSMTATSGGGFCLMTEGLGLASMTETPLVIINGMRPGPATGLPTWSEQGDLLFVLSAHQGDAPRIILAPGDAEEAFYLTAQAFNLADKYQMPVIILIDKNICESDQTVPIFNISRISIDQGKHTKDKIENFNRYAISPDGISTRTFPGTGNYFTANSDEHTVNGSSTEEISDRNSQMEKRLKKLITCAENDMMPPTLYGSKEAEITLVSWGSNKGSILQAMKTIENVNYLHLTWLNPFPTKAVSEILSKAKRIIDIECNFSGQLAELISQKTGIKINERILKYDGRPIFPEEIIDKLTQMSNPYLKT